MLVVKLFVPPSVSLDWPLLVYHFPGRCEDRPRSSPSPSCSSSVRTTNYNSPSLAAVTSIGSLLTMAKTHPRSPSPEPKAAGLKRPKIVHESSTPASAPKPAHHEDAIACFAPDLLNADNVGRLAASYSSNEPFKHALVGKLFRDDFLQKVKDECLSELHFTEKETDIYKVTFMSTFLFPRC